MAMESPLFMDDFPSHKPPWLVWGFPLAMLDDTFLAIVGGWTKGATRTFNNFEP